MILIDDKLTALCSAMRHYDDVRTFTGGQLTRADVLASKADTLLTRSTTAVNASLLAGSNVRFVGTATSGTDHIDQEWCAANTVVVADAAGTNANAVAEWVMAVVAHLGIDHNRTVGIIGYGHVGSRVKRMFTMLGFRTLVNDPPRQRAGLPVPNAVTLDELLRQSAMVTLHVPLTTNGSDRTANLITKRELGLLPSGAILINAARGGVLNESDVRAWMLREGRVVADTFANEPRISVEFARACLLATPHIAGHTLNAFVDASRNIGQAWCTWKRTSPDHVIRECTLAPPLPMPLTVSDVETGAWRSVVESRGLLTDAALLQELDSSLSSNDVGRRFSLIRKHYPLRRETFLL